MFYYSFEEDAIDGSGNNLTIRNLGTTLNTVKATNKAGTFDGQGYIKILNDEYKSLKPINEKISVEAWIKPENQNGKRLAIARSADADGFLTGWRLTSIGTSLEARINITDEIFIFKKDSSTGYNVELTPKDSIDSNHHIEFNGLKIGEWNHIAFTYGDTYSTEGHYGEKEIFLYINGVKSPATIIQKNESVDYTADEDVDPTEYYARKIKYDTTPSAMHIGYSDGIENRFLGEIDEFKLYRGVLSEEEIIKTYNSKKNYYDLELIAHYPFGYSVLDVSGNNLNGTNNNITYRTENNNGSGYFSNQSYVEVESNELLAPSKITVSAWIKPSDLNGIEGIIKSPNGNGWNNGWRFNLNGSSVTARVITDETSDTYGVATTKSGIQENTWNHIAFTYDNESLKVYLNGEEASNSLEGNILYSGTEAMTIGYNRYGNNYYFNGQIDDLKIYNRALSVEELDEIYTSSTYFSSTSSKDLLNNLKENSISISFYPNPTNTIINIEYPYFKGNEKIDIISTSGNILSTQKLEGISTTIDISNLAPNIYFLKFTNTFGEEEIKKILVK